MSCCVTVEGVQHNLFVLLHKKHVEEDKEGKLEETDIIPDLQSVYGDFDMVRKKMGIKLWKGKFVKRRYVFGEPDVPRDETQWLKVVYGFDGGYCYTLNLLCSICVDGTCRASDTEQRIQS